MANDVPVDIVAAEDGATVSVVPFMSAEDFVIDEDTLSLRATTAALALNRIDPPRDLFVEAEQERLNILKEKLKAGEEQQIRDEIALKSTQRQVDILRNNFELLSQTEDPDELLNIVNPVNTDGIMEREASAAMVEAAFNDPIQAAALEQQPERMDAIEAQSYRLARLDAVVENFRKRVQEQGLAQDIGDFAEIFLLPFRTDFFKQNRVKGALGAHLTGNDVENQKRFLMTLDVESGEYDEALTKLVLDLEDNFFGPNPTLALEFLQELRQQSATDKVLANTMLVGEVALTVPILKAGKLLRQPANLFRSTGNRKAAVEVAEEEFNRAVALTETRDVSTERVLHGEVLPPQPTIGGRISGADVEDVPFEEIPRGPRGSGKRNETASIAREAAGLHSVNQIDDVFNQVLPSDLQTDAPIGTGISGELTDRLERESLRRNQIRDQVILGPRVQRLSKEQEIAAIAETDERLVGRLEDGKLVDFYTERNPFNDTLVRYAYIGNGRYKRQGFSNKEAAELAAEERYGFRPGEFEIDDSSGIFFIKVKDQVSEATDTVRSMFVVDPDRIPVTNRIKRFLTGADSVLENLNKNRNHFASSQAARLQRQFRDFTKDLRKVPSWGKKALNEVLYHGQTNEVPPKWYTIEELQKVYQQLHKRLPTDDEVSGYFAMKDLNDLDWFLHNTDIHAELARNGFKKINVAGPAQQWSGNGRIVDEVERARENFVYRIDQDKVLRPGSLTNEDIAELKEQGYKLIDPHESDDLIRNVGTPFRYILAKDQEIDQQILDFIQLNYVPGGHRIYEGKYFIKQARMLEEGGSRFFMRPQTHFVARTKDEAKRLAERWETARQAYLRAVANEITETEATRIISENTYLPDFGEFSRMVDEDLIQANTPFDSVFDREALQIHNSGQYLGSATDELDDIHDWYRTSGRLFYGRKGEHLLDPEGEKADILNPYRSAAAGVNHAIRVSAFGDLTRVNVDTFLETFKDHLEINPSLNRVQNFNRATWKSGTPSEIIAKGESMRKAHLQLIGTPSQETLWFQESMRNIANRMEGIIGTKATKWVMDTTSSDPIVALRSFAFNLKLGLFDISQTLLQSQTAFAALSIDPINGAKGWMSYVPTRMAMINAKEPVVRYIGKKFKSLHGLSEDEFVEYVDDLRRSGAFDVSGNIPIYDELASGLPGNILTNPTTRVLEAGRIPFIEGERLNKTVAFNMAWRKWKKDNPGKKLQGREFEQLVRETDLLAINMSRASNAWWQRGVLSIPTQFMSYQARLVELMLPKMLGGSPDLKARQKAQLAIGQFLLYGSAGIPTLDWVKDRFQEATGEALDVETEQLLFDGVLDNFIFGTLGMDTDFSARAGIMGGGDIFQDIMEGKSFMEIAGGASVSVGNDVLNSFAKIVNMRDLSFNEIVDVTPSLINDIAQNISSWNRASRMAFALETGMYLSSKDKTPIIKDVNTQEAIGLLFGIPLEDVNLYYEMNSQLRETDKRISDKANTVSSLLFEQYRALTEGDEDKARAFGKQIAFIREVSNPRDWRRIQTTALNKAGPKMRPMIEQWLSQKGITNKFKQVTERKPDEEQ